jgi:transcriptional regulator with XRE-family HTH domain
MARKKKSRFRYDGPPVTIFFKEWREHVGLTQQRLADRIGTSKTRISMKETGKEGWDNAFLAALAEALGVEEPASLLIRNPKDKNAPWSLLDGLKPATREKVIDYIEVLRKAEERDAA